jgi:predicted lipoprotein with Yx(FWY)xxD motif
MRPTLKSLLPALALSLTLAACGSSTSTSSTSSSSPSTSTGTTSSAASTSGAGSVTTASNAKLGATVLVDAQGMTVYHLSGESAGKFICDTAACEKAWPPVSASATSASVAGLGTVKRPDGAEQLAYKGEPLYTFAGDKASGEANGQGIKEDGGSWSAVSMGTSGSGAASAPAASTSSSSGESGSGESSGGGSSGGYGY